MLQLVREDHSDCSESEIGAYRVREILPPMRGGETRAKPHDIQRIRNLFTYLRILSAMQQMRHSTQPSSEHVVKGLNITEVA